MVKKRMFWVFWKHFNAGTSQGDAATAIRAPRKTTLPLPATNNQPVMNRPTFSGTNDVSSTLARLGREVFCILDASLGCHYLTENWQKLSGFIAREDTGDGFRERIAPDHLKRVKAYLEKADESASAHFQIKHEDGHWRWCELQLAEADPKTGQHKCLLRDVTSVVLAEGKLEKARLEADLAIKSRSEFLANMSHELRTPLNAILGFAQMIEGGTYGAIGHPKYHEYIESIQASGTTLLSKINDLLEIANIDSGHMELNESSVDISEIIRHAIEFHSHRAFTAQVSLRQHLPIKQLMVTADRIRLLQVVTNVVANAIKYTPAGGTVDIACDLRRDGGVNIMIEDNGDGILPLHLQNILSAFRQDNSFFARSRDCVGLGLALSKEIVKLHQGRIDIESAPGKGTLLTIRLPRERTVKKPQAKKMEPNVILSVN